MVVFSHLDAGTAESVWDADGRLHEVPELDVAIRRLVVVAAHPDDETLGAAGLMARVAAAGARVTVVVATDGEGSHPHSTTHTRARLSAARRDEVVRAVRHVAPAAELHFLLLPDSGLHEQRDDFRRDLSRVLDHERTDSAGGNGLLVVAPWSGDGHRDHRVAAEVVAELCAERGIRHLGYPIWLWHWARPGEVPWRHAEALTLTDEERSAKGEAMAEHRTQIDPLSESPGDEPILHERMRMHFERAREVFVQESASSASVPTQYFDGFYDRHEDPWGFESRWYEKRKREILMASLPFQRLGRVLEVGCATGHVTAELRLRADTVTAIDAAPAAVGKARRRVVGDDVRFIVARVPDEWPQGTFDTVVLSEIGYYFSPEDLDRLIDRIESCGAGLLVACHWRHPVSDYPQTGDAVHRALRRMAGWDTTVSHEERDFVLEVFERSPARSVAQREGLA
ncbi:PIG-L family deacetylase [Microbacterium pumilum]|uniref:Methyltransferase domain-containing protein n=1 Tax=Microbacterium pumilum TaxID=344165 RepID=A0ABN2T0J4_9MICO